MSTGGAAFPSAPHSSTYAAVHVHVHSMLKDKEMLIQGTLSTLASPAVTFGSEPGFEPSRAARASVSSFPGPKLV
ncbi:mCG147356 [Mus musculus]|jgi:hypothetical protein|nr:mCG147356 [Mus musculus]